MSPRASAALIVTCLSLAASAAYFLRPSRAGLPASVCRYGQIGRNLAELRGFKTSAVDPAPLEAYDRRGVTLGFDFATPAPALGASPLQAMLAAAAEKALGTSDRAMIALGAALAAALAGATTWSAGAILGAAVALAPLAAKGPFAAAGPDAALALVLILSIPLLAGRVDESAACSLGLGVGFAILLRPEAAAWLPLGAAALARGDRPFLRVSLFAAATASCALPLLEFERRYGCGVEWRPELSPASVIVLLAPFAAAAARRPALTTALAAAGAALAACDPGMRRPSSNSVDWAGLRAAAAATTAASVVATNVPQELAWYGSRATVSLPEPEHIPTLAARHPVEALLVSRDSSGGIAWSPAWSALLSDPRALDDFAERGGWAPPMNVGASILLVRRRR